MSHGISSDENLPVGLLVLLLVMSLAACRSATAVETGVEPPVTVAEAPAEASTGEEVAAPTCCYYLKLVETPGKEECGELCEITVRGPQGSCPQNLRCGFTADKTLCLTLPPDGDKCPALDDDQRETCIQQHPVCR